MASARSEWNVIYACGIHKRAIRQFVRTVNEISPDTEICMIKCTCDKKLSWLISELIAYSKTEAEILMSRLRGLRIGRMRLRVFWPAEMGYYKRRQLNAKVDGYMNKLNSSEIGCFYIKEIEDKKLKVTENMNSSRLANTSAAVTISNVPESMHEMELFHLASQAGIVSCLKMIKSDKAHVLYNGQAGALTAVLCLDEFEVLIEEPITVKFTKNVKSKFLKQEASRLQNLLKSELNHLLPSTILPKNLSVTEETNTVDQPEIDNQNGIEQLKHELMESQNTHKSHEGVEGVREAIAPSKIEHEEITNSEMDHQDIVDSKTDHENLADSVADHKDMTNSITDHGNLADGRIDHKDTADSETDHENLAEDGVHHEDTVDSETDHGNLADDGVDHEDTADNMVREEYDVPEKVCFLLQQVNLEQKIRDEGYKASFEFANGNNGSKLIAYMIGGTHIYLTEKLFAFFRVIDGIDNLPTRIGNYLAQQSEMRELINKKFQDDNISAGVFKMKDSTSISIVALDSEVHEKATKILKEIFCVKSKKFNITNVPISGDQNQFLTQLQESIPLCCKVQLEAEISDNRTKTCNITATGPLVIVDKVIQAIADKIENDRLMKFGLNINPPLIIEYLRMYFQDDIRRLEKEFKCQIEMVEVLEDDPDINVTTANILITQRQGYKTAIHDKIQSMVAEIVVEREGPFSKYSRLGKFFTGCLSMDELDRLKDTKPCIIAIASNENYRVLSQRKGKFNLNLQKDRQKSGVYQSSVLNARTALSSKTTTKTCSSILQNEKDKVEVNNVTIRLVKGRIEKEGAQCDTIVNSIDLNDYDHGNIAKALNRAGGSSYLTECRSQLRSLAVDSIGYTSGFYFGCKAVYHIPFLSSDRSLLWLSNRVQNCLVKGADEHKQSIAIPAIGTGEAGINIDELAKEMIRISVEFALDRPKYLQNISFIIYPTDVKTLDAFEKALTSAIPLANQLLHQKELVHKVTSSQRSIKLENESKSLFSAQYEANNRKVFVEVYQCNADDLKADAVMDVTALCSEHSYSDSLSETIQIANDGTHTSQTLQIIHILGCNLYRVCIYDCLVGVKTVLACMNANDEKSVTIPLLSINMDASHIDSLVDSIKEFIVDHCESEISIRRINFAIGYDDRAREIATWMQQKIKKEAFPSGWKITNSVPVLASGVSILYVASDKAVLKRLKSKMNESMDTWSHRRISNEDYFQVIDTNCWYRLVLRCWSEFNTILSSQKMRKIVDIQGLEKDIVNTMAIIHKLSKQYFLGEILNSEQKFGLDISKWYAKIGQTKWKFDSNLNYEIERNFKIYEKNKAKKNFYVDSETKVIDFENMHIKLDDNEEFPIGKFSAAGIAIPIPNNWENVSENQIEDGYFSTVYVTDRQEINKVAAMIKASAPKYCVSRLRRVQNWNLYQKYQAMKADVTKAIQKYKPETQAERYLFHCTKTEYVDKICQGGFNRDYSGKSIGSVYGTGTYFAVQAQLSLSYGGGLGNHRLLLVRVLTGIYDDSVDRNKPTLSIIPGSSGERVHSAVDHKNKPSMFIVFNDNSAYPEYIIEGRVE
ncbi:Poly [ADP-ribose] polymerase 14 [Trichoplax sp. H2]|nr:Poly [ADP-ribose] polymerase 14 [Trichoplax sp. H2]|eukprot:RDD38024.1 Poly [ADP-ribose] polymerase 14 [Trichoplax sp. H2]